MEDTCSPKANYKFHSYKIYSIVVPILLMFLVLEVVFIFMSIPTSIGAVLSSVGPFSSAKVPLSK